MISISKIWRKAKSSETRYKIELTLKEKTEKLKEQIYFIHNVDELYNIMLNRRSPQKLYTHVHYYIQVQSHAYTCVRLYVLICTCEYICTHMCVNVHTHVCICVQVVHSVICKYIYMYRTSCLKSKPTDQKIILCGEGRIIGRGHLKELSESDNVLFPANDIFFTM